MSLREHSSPLRVANFRYFFLGEAINTGFFSFVAMPIGQVLVGPLASQFGIRGVELGAFALSILVMIVGLSIPAVNKLRLDGSAAKAAKA